MEILNVFLSFLYSEKICKENEVEDEQIRNFNPE